MSDYESDNSSSEHSQREDVEIICESEPVSTGGSHISGGTAFHREIT
jgi:hypothetical protein